MNILRKYTYAAVLAVCLLPVTGCHTIPEYEDTSEGNFDLLWTLFDEHYCFFAEKGVDWDAVRAEYAPRAASCKTRRELFRLCAEMLDELRDGHVNLSSSFATSYYSKWWTDFPQDYNERVVLENYLHFNYQQLGPVKYTILLNNIGYISIPTFASGLGEGNIDNILAYMALCDGLIIDVRDNGGGDMTSAEKWVERFISRRTLAGYIQHKTGPGHDDFSKPYAYYYEPQAGRVRWNKPVAVLTNRSTFSAANNFVSVMRDIDGVTTVGARTGGGSGMPLTFDLPAGWNVRMSACPVYDAQMRLTETGVEAEVPATITVADIAAGRDPILDAAVVTLLNAIQ